MSEKPQETVTIPKAEYERLLQDSNWLNILEQAGIDNSEAYDYACALKRKAIESGEMDEEDFP